MGGLFPHTGFGSWNKSITPHRLRCRNKLILQKHQGEWKGVYHSGLFLRCSYLTALPLYAEEANHPHWLHQMQNGTWLGVPMHLPYLVTRKTKQILIWHTWKPMLLLESTPKLVWRSGIQAPSSVTGKFKFMRPALRPCTQHSSHPDPGTPPALSAQEF